MAHPNEISLEYTSELTPVNPATANGFLQKLADYTTSLYETRLLKVDNRTPLLASEETPAYKQTEIDDYIAYSIDARNIRKWMLYFLNDEFEMPKEPTPIVFDIAPQHYDYDTDTFTIEMSNGTELTFKIESPVDIDLNQTEATLRIQYAPHTGSLQILFEEDAVIAGEDFILDEVDEEHTTFTTAYNEYQSYLSGEIAEKHQPFAIYSPGVDYQKAAELAAQQCPDGAIVIVTNDDWKVCVRSDDDDDYVVDVSVVELLNPVSHTIEDYYEQFAYPQRYIHIPELQYIHSLDDARLTDEEELRLRTLPYTIPFGNEAELTCKLSHAERFDAPLAPEAVRTQLQYEQFLDIPTTLNP